MRMPLEIVVNDGFGGIELGQHHEGFHKRNPRDIIAGIETYGVAELLGGLAESIELGVDDTQIQVCLRVVRVFFDDLGDGLEGLVEIAVFRVGIGQIQLQNFIGRRVFQHIDCGRVSFLCNQRLAQSVDCLDRLRVGFENGLEDLNGLLLPV